jgi:chromosome partitioning protein
VKTIAIGSCKGGTGKTTLSAALAVRAAREGRKVALFDTDAQCSLVRWWELRGSPNNPKMIEVDPSLEAFELLISEGWDWVFIDTPPGAMDTVEHAVFSADLVLIPCRPSPVDVEAVDDIVDLCNEHGKPFAFILNAVPHGWGKLADSAAGYLAQSGPVLKQRVASRKPYVAAMTLGKSGAELDRAAREEIDALWTEIKRTLAKATKAVA